MRGSTHIGYWYDEEQGQWLYHKHTLINALDNRLYAYRDLARKLMSRVNYKEETRQSILRQLNEEEEYILVLLTAGEERYPGFYNKQTGTIYYKRYTEYKELLEHTVLANIG